MIYVVVKKPHLSKDDTIMDTMNMDMLVALNQMLQLKNFLIFSLVEVIHNKIFICVKGDSIE